MTTEIPAKQEALDLIQTLREDASWAEIMDAIYMRQRLEWAEQEEAECQLYTQEEVEEYIKKWLP
ncbi:MAG TPA: hypothetical protein VKK79_25855 [Candidatus Lokiarchaeia archaeon]|nr:hypothetical protein [Candidatus Lokiarchaeia archaeon]